MSNSDRGTKPARPPREIELFADALREQGFESHEKDPMQAVLEMRETREAMGAGTLGRDGGRHTKGGLFGMENDYFGDASEVEELNEEDSPTEALPEG